jgi:pimeloyl-ACP methyl ester carboxylesterase
MEQPSQNIVHRIPRKAPFGLDKFILVGNQRIHYIEAGTGNPLLLLPGSFTTQRIWNRLIPLLAAQYRVLAPRAQAGFSVEGQTDLLAAMVRQMEIKKVDLLGGPAVGEMVFDFAARYPDQVNKIISIQGGVFVAPEPAKKPGKGWPRLSFSGRNPGQVAERAKSIRAVVLFLYGSKCDVRAVPLTQNIQFLRDFLPQSWIVCLEGGIHEISMHSPEEISDLILLFLSTDLSPKKAGHVA